MLGKAEKPGKSVQVFNKFETAGFFLIELQVVLIEAETFQFHFEYF